MRIPNVHVQWTCDEIKTRVIALTNDALVCSCNIFLEVICVPFIFMHVLICHSIKISYWHTS